MYQVLHRLVGIYRGTGTSYAPREAQILECHPGNVAAFPIAHGVICYISVIYSAHEEEEMHISGAGYADAVTFADTKCHGEKQIA